MSRIARVVIPGLPHHVTQRGVRRMNVFTEKSDPVAYLSLIKQSCAKAKTEILAYCLMPDHVHFIMVPSHEDGLRAALGDAHRRYTRMINARQKCSGHRSIGTSVGGGYVRYVGRVGALAVALGVGSAVAAMPVAFADEVGSPGAAGSGAGSVSGAESGKRAG